MTEALGRAVDTLSRTSDLHGFEQPEVTTTRRGELDRLTITTSDRLPAPPGRINGSRRVLVWLCSGLFGDSAKWTANCQ